ncbi:MAG TPA: CpsD/CapB family tyrosine-protein kinase [Steroidobacteraceae bacterium]|nr:CpsD/CapB family tyrosine-protein kinase [Steroidobacteraceae bacterium]
MMSIIEEAVRKTSEQHNRVPPETGHHSRVRRIVPAPAPADVSQAKRFKSVSLDQSVLERNCVLPGVQDAAALRAYKILRTRITRRLEAQQWRSFGVTGLAPGDGKTLTSINLAISLAQNTNTWVFLVDMDLRRYQVARSLGLSGANGEPGLSDYLKGDASVDDIIYSPGIERLAIIPNFQPITESSEMMTTPRMSELLQALERETPRRIIIFDLPPLLAADDVIAFAPQIDSMLLVVSEGSTNRAQLEAAKETLSEMNLLGVVLNRSAETSDTDYYAYGA